jgi:anthranilate phosphoribosyltransferase
MSEAKEYRCLRGAMDIKGAIKKVVAGENLTERQMNAVFNDVMSGKTTPAQMGAFITALRLKGETADEITGAARVMRQKAIKLKVRGGASRVLDTCGTGGTGTYTFNISTASALVLAGCGVMVAKHGNRSASSHCGSADVLEELGVRIDAPLKVIERSMDSINVAFLFAPLFHGAMKYAAAVRKEIGIRTIFNMLGPLSNPASARLQVMGVYDPALTEMMARVLKNIGSKRAFVVHGEGPLDEVSISGKTRISELNGSSIRTYYVNPSDFGVKKRDILSVKGGDAKKNASILLGILSGGKGPCRDITLMNSSVALVAAGKARNFKEGMKTAAKAVDSGEAMTKLEMLISITAGNKLKATP